MTQAEQARKRFEKKYHIKYTDSPCLCVRCGAGAFIEADGEYYCKNHHRELRK